MIEPVEVPCRYTDYRRCVIIDPQRITCVERYEQCPGICHRFDLDISGTPMYDFIQGTPQPHLRTDNAERE